MCYTYILKCSDDSYYIGSTKDIERRLLEHSEGEGALWTMERLPIKLVYLESFNRIDYAFEREHQIKKWSRAKKEALISGSRNRLIQLAMNSKSLREYVD